MTNGMFILVLLEIIRELCVKFEVFSQILKLSIYILIEVAVFFR